MRLTVKVKNMTRQGLQDLKAEVPRIGRLSIRRMMEDIRKTMRVYAPERPEQKYKRTGKFGANWKIERMEDVGYTLSNTAQRKGKYYGHYVVGNAYGNGQAWMHKDRWQVFRDVVDWFIERMPKTVADAIKTVTRRYAK